MLSFMLLFFYLVLYLSIGALCAEATFYIYLQYAKNKMPDHPGLAYWMITVSWPLCVLYLLWLMITGQKTEQKP